jgi:hypothetical protein
VAPFDEPFLALSLLQSAYQRRFLFGRLGLDRKLGPRIRILEFEEVQRPSLIRNGINELLISGRVWMDEESGKGHDTEDRIADPFGVGCAIRQGSDPWASGDCRGYTTGMKTAVSLPDRVYREAEGYAKRTRKSRSQLYAEALAEYLARHAPDEVTEAMNVVVDELGDTAADAFVHHAALRMLRSVEW